MLGARLARNPWRNAVRGGYAGAIACAHDPVVRVGQPFCAGRIDLQNYFRATLSGAVESIPPTNEACSLFKHQRHAVVVRALPNLGLVKLKVSVEHGTVTGWTTNAGMDVP